MLQWSASRSGVNAARPERPPPQGKPDNFTNMTLTLDKLGNGVRLEQGFDVIWNAQGLRKLAAALKGAAELLEA